MSHALSIVIPVYNSRANLANLLSAIDQERMQHHWDLELLLVDDGSRDSSYEMIVELAEKYHYLKGIKLSRNFGHQATVRTGLSFVTKPHIAVMDDDLQDPPTLLPVFLKKLDEGYDVVYGVRKKRKEGLLKVWSYNIFYRLLKKLSDTSIPLDSGDFCVMTNRVVDHMLTFQEQRPFLRGIRAWVGFKQIGLEYERDERKFGDSGYTLKKLLNIALDGIFAFSSTPIRFIAIAGAFGLFIGFLYAAYTLGLYVVYGISIQGFTSIVLLIIFFGSLNLISIGIAGEYIYRIFLETKNRPHSIIDSTVNI